MNKTEIVVLGAGMVGVGSALALQQRGHAVTLIDRKKPGQETSYGNAGIIQREAMQPYAFPRDWMKLLRVATGQSNDVHYHLGAMWRLAPLLVRYWAASAPQAYEPIAAAYGRLIEHCISEHQDLIEAANAENLVHKHGWREIYRSAAAFEHDAAAAVAVAKRHGLDCQIMDSQTLARAEPALKIALAGAIHWRDPWSISDPGELVTRYAKLFIQRGGVFAHGDALSLAPSGSGWSVSSEHGVVNAAQVVVALGPWAPTLTERLGYKLPLFVKRGYHRHYAPNPSKRDGSGTVQMPMLDTENGVMLAPMARGLRLTTGAEFARLDARATPVQLGRAEHAVRQLLDLGAPVEATPWLGARPCTVDMKPVIGAAPRHKGLWFNFGHSHQGFTLGPATGRLLAEMMHGETPYIDPAPYRPERFKL